MTAHIYFHHNNIRSLPTNLIYGSKSLRSADFEYNRLQAVRFVKPENRLKSKNMHTIDLSRNWRMGQDLNTVSLKPDQTFDRQSGRRRNWPPRLLVLISKLGPSSDLSSLFNKNFRDSLQRILGITNKVLYSQSIWWTIH